MDKRSELEYKLKKIKYDLETKQMEYRGLQVRYHDLKTQNIYYVIIFIIIAIFIKLMIDNMFEPFAVVLGPIYGVIFVIYIFFMIKNFINCFLNSNIPAARKIAGKRHIASLNEKMEKCLIEIGIIERKVAELEIELEEMDS